MTDAELIAEFIERRGVTQCPPVALIPTSTEKLTGVKIPDPIGDAARAHARYALTKARRSAWRGAQLGGRRKTFPLDTPGR